MKATHQGSCQRCGRIQKLPSDRLSLHGYTKQWGFFNGTCPGSRALPYELDCSLCRAAVAWADAEIVRLQTKAVEVRQPVTEPKGRVRDYSRRYITWEDITVLSTTHTYETGRTFKLYHYIDSQGRQHRLDFYNNRPSDELEAANRLNESYAKAVYDAQIAQLQQYRSWQQERVTNWKLQPLQEIE